MRPAGLHWSGIRQLGGYHGDNCGTEGAQVWLKHTSVCGTTAPPSKINKSALTCSSECTLASVPPASVSHDCDGLPLQEERTSTCEESYGTKLSATALTAQMCHFDGYTYGDTGLPFPSYVTTTLLQCFDSTVAQAEKFDACDGTNSTVGETCVGSCSWRQSKSKSVACPTGSLPACHVTRCSTSTNPGSIGARKDDENITCGASHQGDGAVGFECQPP